MGTLALCSKKKKKKETWTNPSRNQPHSSSAFVLMHRTPTRALCRVADTCTLAPFHLRALAAAAAGTSSANHAQHLGRRGHKEHGRKPRPAKREEEDDSDREDEEDINKLAGADDTKTPDEYVVGDLREQLAENVGLDEEREIGREGGEGRLHALHDAEKSALERRGYGGEEVPYTAST